MQLQIEKELHNSASLAVYRYGDQILNVTCGTPTNLKGDRINPDGGAPLYRAFSCGKAMVAATIWRLLDAGAVEIDAPVAEYWPEFAQRAKHKVTLRHALTHTSGLPYEPDAAEWQDWGRVTDMIAGMPLESQPGDIIQYHSLTFGWIVGEIAARAAGLSFEEVFEREVRTPLQLQDTFFAISPDDTPILERVAKLTASCDYPSPEMPANMNYLLEFSISAPGGTCVTSADDLSRLYSAVSNHGVASDGRRWLTREAARNVYKVHKHGYDIDDMTEKLVGQGVWLTVDDLDRSAAPLGSKTFGHGGMATSVAWGDPEHSLSFALLTDKMIPEDRNRARLNRVSAAVRHDLKLPAGQTLPL